VFPSLLLVGLIQFEVAAGDARTVSFDRDVRPILVGRCFRCHGPGTAEAGLRLSDSVSGLATLESGERAVVPGDPDASELIRRITAADDARMPPDSALTGEQIATLRDWIAQGTNWPQHWAYRPLQPTPPPSLSGKELNDWAQTPVDNFIAARLEEENLAPSPEADRRTLLRRVTLDLIGLPPTPAEYDAFLADERPGAYERVVERLLASPHYGERWARRWMDLVHYAESHGQDQDRPRENSWPYREFLIKAFNRDLPYADFVRWQVAGDALRPDDAQAIIATGFLATGPWDESSLRDINEDSIDRQIARYLDRDDIVTTVMSTLTSTSVQCARCHDHKFDPISQNDYYALQAVFAGVDKANRAFDADPQVARTRHELEAKRDRARQFAAAKDAQLLDLLPAPQLAEWEVEYARTLGAWRPAAIVAAKSGGGATVTPQNDRSLLASGARPDKDIYTVDLRPDGQRLTGLQLEVLAHDDLPMRGPGRQDNGNLHLNEIRAFVVSPQQGIAAREITLQNPIADFDQDGWTIAMAVDGNPNTAWGIHPAVGQDHQAVIEFATPIELAGDEQLRIELHQIHGGGHLIGRLRLNTTDQPAPFPRQFTAVPPEVRAALKLPVDERSTEQSLAVTAFCLEQTIAASLKQLPAPSLVYCGTNQFTADKSFRPAETPREVRVLGRGQINAPGDVAAPGTIAGMGDLPSRFELAEPQNEAARRIALADWLSDERNVLVWRSIVNRAWQQRFGRGLVDTPSDFGHLGGSPTHPELLDWLTVEFQRHGGSLKWLDQLLVTSAVYRQSSAHRAEPAAVDQANTLLWRMNVRRLDAEQIRDAILQQSGRLDPQMEGPSVRQFIQSPGIQVTPTVDYLGFDVDAPANQRRSVYRFVFRTLPDPFMEAMDCPDASQLAPERTESVTALQALATLNDRHMARQAELLATQLQADHPQPDDQIAALIEVLFARTPRPGEAAAVAKYVQQHGLANAARFLWNTNEFMFVE